MLKPYHKDQHDSRVQNGEQRQKVFRKPQPLCHIQTKKVCAHHVGDIQDHRNSHCFEHTPILQHTGNQLAVFPQHMKNRYSPCLCAPDFALLRFMAKPEGDERFQDHCQRKKKIQHPYYRHDRIRTDEQTGKRRKKDGHQSANIYPGIDSYQILWACVLNQQAVPCRLIDLLKAIQDCSGQKQPEIVRNSPHQTGQPPSEKIPHHGSEFSSQLVRQNAPQKGKQHLDCHRDGENQANLHICDALCVHIKSGERCDKVVRDAPQRFDQHKRTRIPPIVGQHLNERMCLQTSYF